MRANRVFFFAGSVASVCGTFSPTWWNWDKRTAKEGLDTVTLPSFTTSFVDTLLASTLTVTLTAANSSAKASPSVAPEPTTVIITDYPTTSSPSATFATDLPSDLPAPGLSNTITPTTTTLVIVPPTSTHTSTTVTEIRQTEISAPAGPPNSESTVTDAQTKTMSPVPAGKSTSRTTFGTPTGYVGATLSTKRTATSATPTAAAGNMVRGGAGLAAGVFGVVGLIL